MAFQSASMTFGFTGLETKSYGGVSISWRPSIVQTFRWGFGNTGTMADTLAVIEKIDVGSGTQVSFRADSVQPLNPGYPITAVKIYAFLLENTGVVQLYTFGAGFTESIFHTTSAVPVGGLVQAYNPVGWDIDGFSTIQFEGEGNAHVSFRLWWVGR